MEVICDIETNGLTPDKIWVICCKDINTGEVYVFRPFNEGEVVRFLDFAQNISLWVGHNFLGFDHIWLDRILGLSIPLANCIDTLVLSRLVDATRDGHSLEEWGTELGVEKRHADITDWSAYTPELEERCISDIEINFLLYNKFRKYILSEKWRPAIDTEQYIHHLCVTLHENGFSYDLPKALELKRIIDIELKELTDSLTKVFPLRILLVKEVLPKVTKHGTINKQSIPRVLGNDYTPYHPDAPFSLIEYEEFNPGSPKQRIERLNEAGWRPFEKTKGHKLAERAKRKLERKRRKAPHDLEEIQKLSQKLEKYQTYGWTCSEANLSTLPETAPEGIRKLVRWLLLNSRSNKLTEWENACTPLLGPTGSIEDYRIHGRFNSIGPWTHRMSHDRPNMGNVPKFNEKRPETTPYSDQMRALWKAREGRLLVGVDAESIQLRIFGHYVNDPELIKALCEGKKEDETDPHSVNRRALGNPCKSRDDAKTFIYAWVLGAGLGQVSTILGCSAEEAKEADKNFLDRYPGLRYIKEEVVPIDAARGYFQGFDGRYVKIWGEDENERRHFTLAGYLQNGEAVIMKRAVQIWYPKLKKEKIPFWWVNFVHDEWQTETIDDMEVAEYVARTQADAIRQVGDDLRLNCPMAGSILNAHGKLAIGDNWMVTH